MQVFDNQNTFYCICYCSKSCKYGWHISERIRIEVLLEERKSFSQIAAELGKSTTTISREVLRHRSIVCHFLFQLFCLSGSSRFIICSVSHRLQQVLKSFRSSRNNCWIFSIRLAAEFRCRSSASAVCFRLQLFSK